MVMLLVGPAIMAMFLGHPIETPTESRGRRVAHRSTPDRGRSLPHTPDCRARTSHAHRLGSSSVEPLIVFVTLRNRGAPDRGVTFVTWETVSTILPHLGHEESPSPLTHGLGGGCRSKAFLRGSGVLRVSKASRRPNPLIKRPLWASRMCLHTRAEPLAPLSVTTHHGQW